MDPHTTFLLFSLALACSVLGGMLGMASGMFIVPALTILAHMSIHEAIGASLVSVIACSCASAAPYLRGQLTNVRLAVLLEVGTTLGALSGVLLIGVVPVRALYLLFAAILLVSAWQMFLRRVEAVAPTGSASRDGTARSLGLHASYPDPATGREVPYVVARVPFGLVLMYAAGLISALLGIGSGVLKVPAMDTALRLPIRVSTATSNFMIGVTGCASACAYFLRGEIATSVAAPVALGSVVGSIAGAHILMKTPTRHLRVFFVSILVLVAVQMLLHGLD